MCTPPGLIPSLSNLLQLWARRTASYHKRSFLACMWSKSLNASGLSYRGFGTHRCATDDTYPRELGYSVIYNPHIRSGLQRNLTTILRNVIGCSSVRAQDPGTEKIKLGMITESENSKPTYFAALFTSISSRLSLLTLSHPFLFHPPDRVFHLCTASY